MRKPLYLYVAATALSLSVFGGVTSGQSKQRSAPLPKSTPQILFDDFNYSDSKKMVKHGWIIRTADGWPGIPGAKWLTKSVSFISDTEKPSNRIVRMTSSTDGTSTNTIQTQICHERKYREGTYAARVRFTDQPVSGPAGDQIVQSFYTISPQKAPMDPDYSELDFEYLPNGGWGETGTMIYATSWFTFRLEPWFQDNMSNHVPGSQAGWHTLVTQVADGKVKYFVDGKILAEHGGKFYPRVLMSINFNLWFIKDGTITSPDKREYQEDIDWVFHQANAILSPAEVITAVDSLRRKTTRYKDTVTAPVPALGSPCNF